MYMEFHQQISDEIARAYTDMLDLKVDMVSPAAVASLPIIPSLTSHLLCCIVDH
jgi:hypothetical protein